MVNGAEQSTCLRRLHQGVRADIPEPPKIGAFTPFDFFAHRPTTYGGLPPVATMLEKLGFQPLIAETLTIRQQTRAMPVSLMLPQRVRQGRRISNPQ